MLQIIMFATIWAGPFQPPALPPGREDLVSFEEILGEVRLLSEEDPEEAILLLKGILDRYTSNYQLYEASWLLFNTFFEEGRFRECMAVWQVEQSRGLFFPILAQHEEKLSSFEDFGTIYQENERLKELAQQKHRASYEIRKPENYDPKQAYPLLIVLHDDNSNICWMNQLWRSPKMNQQFLVAFLRSSEKVGSYAFSWSESALEDVAYLYQQISGAYHIDPEYIVLGGYGKGAAVALDAGLSHAVPAKGLLAFCPTDNALEMRLGKRSEKRKGVRACLISEQKGEQRPKVQRMTRLFKEYELPHRVIGLSGHVCPGTGDFEKHIDEALAFIME